MILDAVQLQLLHAGKIDLDQKWNFENVLSPFYRMYLITEGEAYVYHSGKQYTLLPGYMYLIPSFTYSRYLCKTNHTQYYLGVLEEFGEIGSVFDHYNFKYQVKALKMDEELFQRLLSINPKRDLVNYAPKHYDNIPTLNFFKSKNKELSASSYLETKSLLGILLSRFIETAKTPSKETNNKIKLHESIKYIKQHLHEELTVQKIASKVNLSADYFSKEFHRAFGIKPLKYIQTKKIERAQILLTSTNESLSSIAEKVGFEHLSYFSRLFKSLTGITPGKYRQELRENS